MNAQAVCHDSHDEVKPSDVSGKNVDGNSQFVSVSTQNNRIKGSPYAFNDWCKCEVIATDNSIAKYNKVQFNLEKNQLITYNNGIPSVIPTNKITSFTATDKNSIRQFTYIDKSNFIDSNENKLYEVFSTKNYLIKETTKYVQTSSDDSGKMYYKKRTSYYILNSSGKYVKTKLSKKHLLKTLKDKEKDVLKYIKENKLSYKEKDVSKILSFYHSLT